MQSVMRFGQRIPLPSIVQIKHDVRMYAEKAEKEKIRTFCADAEGLPSAATWGELAEHYRARIALGPFIANTADPKPTC
jgi:hypothetical protein